MAHSDLVDSLIATYRTLNLRIRPLPEGTGGDGLLEAMAELRMQELVASQQLKDMTTAEIAGARRERVDVLPPPDNATARTLLSEFGTAREAILAAVREMPDAGWSDERQGPHGSTTVHAFIENIAQRDKAVLAKIEGLLTS